MTTTAPTSTTTNGTTRHVEATNPKAIRAALVAAMCEPHAVFVRARPRPGHHPLAEGAALGLPVRLAHHVTILAPDGHTSAFPIAAILSVVRVDLPPWATVHRPTDDMPHDRDAEPRGST